MKVVFVSPKYAPNVGGVETNVRETAERLVDRGYTVSVVTGDDGPTVDRRARIEGVRVLRTRGWSPDDAFHIAPGVASTVASLDADVVHVHNYHGLPMVFGAFAPLVRGTPLVATPHYHAGSASDFRDRLLSAYRYVAGPVLRRSDEVIAVSNWEADRLREDFGIESSIIPNGIQIGRFRDAEPESRERPYLLTVGRLEAYKGVQHVIRALPGVPELDLVVAGTGDYLDHLRTVATDTGVADRVSFEGYVDEDRLPRLYAGAEAYVTLSEFEAYGLTVGEALAAGTPCVVRESGALVDWSGRTDCVGVPAVDPESVQRAVGEAVGRQAPDPDRPLADWDDVTDDLVALYRGVVDR